MVNKTCCSYLHHNKTSVLHVNRNTLHRIITFKIFTYPSRPVKGRRTGPYFSLGVVLVQHDYAECPRRVITGRLHTYVKENGVAYSTEFDIDSYRDNIIKRETENT